MKKNIVPIVVVVVLFACVAVVSFASKGSGTAARSREGTGDATVKICPHSGLPCEGDGDCEEDCEENSSASDATSEEGVKICPETGLPCEGAGDCEE